MKIGVVSQDDTGVDYHRLLKPFSLMEGITRCQGINSDIFEMGFDIIVFSRILPVLKQKEFIRELQKRGVYVICDIDDHWILSNTHVAKKVGDSYRTQSIEALRYSDEVWTTHEHLAKRIEPLNANWHVIPNALDPDEEQWQPKDVNGNKIGWSGGMTHFHDLMLTKGCFTRKPVVGGWYEDPEWHRLKKSFPAEYVRAMDIWNYGRIYEMFDIAIAPLTGDKFNTYKSNLKILEAGIKGLPIFVQDMHPYTDDAKGIYKVANWKDAIHQAEQMVVERIVEDGKDLRQYVIENYNLHEVNKLRLERL